MSSHCSGRCARVGQICLPCCSTARGNICLQIHSLDDWECCPQSCGVSPKSLAGTTYAVLEDTNPEASAEEFSAMDTVAEESDGQSSGSRQHSTFKSAKGEFRMSDSPKHSRTDDSIRARWDTSCTRRVTSELCATVARQSSSLKSCWMLLHPRTDLQMCPPLERCHLSGRGPAEKGWNSGWLSACFTHPSNSLSDADDKAGAGHRRAIR